MLARGTQTGTAGQRPVLVLCASGWKELCAIKVEISFYWQLHPRCWGPTGGGSMHIGTPILVGEAENEEGKSMTTLNVLVMSLRKMEEEERRWKSQGRGDLAGFCHVRQMALEDLTEEVAFALRPEGDT